MKIPTRNHLRLSLKRTNLKVMGSKQLAVVLDCAADLELHWKTGIKDLLVEIIRYLYTNGSTTQDFGPRAYFNLVAYGSEGPLSVEQWTNDPNSFLEWLSAVPFIGGESNEAALAKGLSTALKMFATSKACNAAKDFGQNHCILVTSCKSLPRLQPVSEDQLSDYEKDSRETTEGLQFDATSVAQNFIQSFVSLSIISPDESPRLKEIFMEGNMYNPLAGRHPIIQRNPNCLILLSHIFTEAHAALGAENHNGNFPEVDLQTVDNNFTGASHTNQPESNPADMFTQPGTYLLEDPDWDCFPLEDLIGDSSQAGGGYNQESLTNPQYPIIHSSPTAAEDAQNLPVVGPLHEFGATSSNSIMSSQQVLPEKEITGLPNLAFGGHEPTNHWIALAKSVFGTGIPRDPLNVRGRPLVSHGVSSSSRAIEHLGPFHSQSNVAPWKRVASGRVKAWEGNLTELVGGKLDVVDRLVVYRCNSTSQMLFSYWPERLILNAIIYKAQGDQLQLSGKLATLFVDSMQTERNKVARKELRCVYIKLPHQVLVLYPPPEGNGYVGELYNAGLYAPMSLN